MKKRMKQDSNPTETSAEVITLYPCCHVEIQDEDGLSFQGCGRPSIGDGHIQPHLCDKHLNLKIPSW